MVADSFITGTVTRTHAATIVVMVLAALRLGIGTGLEGRRRCRPMSTTADHGSKLNHGCNAGLRFIEGIPEVATVSSGMVLAG